MTLEEKLNLFYETVIDDATSQKKRLLDEHRESLESTYNDYKKDLLQKSEVMIRSERENLKREKNRRLSLTARDIKRKISEEVISFKDIIFFDVMIKLKDYMQTGEYIKLLEEQIKEAIKVAHGEEMTIYINQTDEDKKIELEKAVGVELTVSAMDFLGGIRAVIHSRRILIDNSFEKRLEEEKEVYQMSI